LVHNWKLAWRWSSMHAMGAALAIQGAWVAIPAEMQQLVHPIVAHIMTGFLLVLGIIARLVDQTPKPKVEDDNAEHA
ncbi:MAG TPA: hypothetical protein VIY48_08280, partial [Candidatus Paceibacterota bacterium]